MRLQGLGYIALVFTLSRCTGSAAEYSAQSLPVTAARTTAGLQETLGHVPSSATPQAAVAVNGLSDDWSTRVGSRKTRPTVIFQKSTPGTLPRSALSVGTVQEPVHHAPTQATLKTQLASRNGEPQRPLVYPSKTPSVFVVSRKFHTTQAPSVPRTNVVPQSVLSRSTAHVPRSSVVYQEDPRHASAAPRVPQQRYQSKQHVASVPSNAQQHLVVHTTPGPFPSSVRPQYRTHTGSQKQLRPVGYANPKESKAKAVPTRKFTSELPVSGGPPLFHRPQHTIAPRAPDSQPEAPKYEEQPPPPSAHNNDVNMENDDFFNYARSPYSRHSDSFEDIRRHIQNEPYDDSNPEPYHRPFFTMPKPMDFDMSNLDQKGCKMTVKEVKQVPKDTLKTSGSNLHNLFRHKREVKEDSRMTSIIMTKECYFPSDPTDTSSRGETKRSSSRPSPRHINNHHPSQDSGEDASHAQPYARPSDNNPTYSPYYRRHSTFPRPKFRTFSAETGDSYGHADSRYFPVTSHLQVNSDSIPRQKKMKASPTFKGEHQAEDQRDYNDYRNRYRPPYEHRPNRGSEATHREDRRDEPSRGGRRVPQPQTMDRSFSFYRRDENPEKDRFMESYQTAHRKSYRSDYDSDRDGL